MKNLQVNLNYNYGYRWYSNNNIKVKGYFFDEKNFLYEKDNLLNYFENINTEEEFKNRISSINGIFSVIIQNKKFIMLAVDKTRTFPLFYIDNENDFIISDDSYYLKENHKNNLDEINSDEFLSIGHVMGKETLLKNIFQIQSGEFLISNDNRFKKSFYFDYLTKNISIKIFDELKSEFLDILRDLIQRIIKFANGRQIVIPLSGGYDSRLIASLLRQANYENVFCFTYGRKSSHEVIISEKVAKELNYNWLFVEYNEQTIDQNYPQSNEFQEFYKFASNHTSIFHIQDYFAVKYLHDNQIIDNDAIFAPGHSGDFLGGSHFDKSEIANKNNIIDIIYQKQKILNKKTFNNKKALKEKISSLIEGENIKEEFIYSIDENFNLRERQSKFIVNAQRVYEYFGYQHSMPLWDSKIIDFFKVLPLKYKLNSYFYEKIIFEEVFNHLNVQYKKSKTMNDKNKDKIKKIIRTVFPDFLEDIIMKYKNPDINRETLFAIPLLKEINENILLRHSNLIIAKWYISKIKFN
tara:strand:+ start:2686 stop:4254 length:1569 start_codon:yes stop_codon:yes gene_type:complete